MYRERYLFTCDGCRDRGATNRCGCLPPRWIMARIYYATDDGRLHPLAHSVHACSVECLARIVVERTGADRLCAIEGVDVMPAEGNVGRVADDREGDYA